jgi:GntR family transcriptional regulator, galactonate operon transcriptional repressor
MPPMRHRTIRTTRKPEEDVTAAVPAMIDSGEPLARRSLHDQIVDEIGRRIVRGEYGASLPTEPLLAAKLGVSRNALREAVKVLVAKGMVEVRPKTGMRILPERAWNLLDRDVLVWHAHSERRLTRAFELVEFRLIVEPMAAYLAAKRASAEEIAVIDANCTALEACVGKPLQIPEVDIAFHHSIYEASHNAILSQMASLTSSLMQIQVLMTTQKPGSFESGLPLHREVAEAIRARDAHTAEHAAHRLAQMPYDDLAQRIKLTPKKRMARLREVARLVGRR